MLKSKHSIKTNLVFVSGLQHAAACAGVAAITMSVDTVSYNLLMNFCKHD